MKKFTSILLALMIAVTVFTSLPFTVSAAENSETAEVGARSGTTGDCTWTLDDYGTLTISGNGDMDSGFPQPWDDFCNEIYNVVIESGVTNIGGYAFSGCKNLKNLTISDSVMSIEGFSFMGCSNLVNVSIPDGVTEINDGVFADCINLMSITIPDSITTIGDSVFSGCDNLIIYSYSESITEDKAIRNGIKFVSVGQSQHPISFSGTEIVDQGTTGDCVWTIDNAGLLTISGNGEMPNYGMTSYHAPWYGSWYNINTVIIENGVTSIGDYAFDNLPATRIIIPESVTKIGELAFSGSYFSTIIVPNSVTNIDSVFSNCEKVEYVKLPNTLSSIGEDAFFGCRNLRTIDIPDSVTSIEGEAFALCESLKSISIPASVSKIEYGSWEGAFRRCSSLSSIVVDENNPVYDSREHCNSIIETKTNTLIKGSNSSYIPNSVTKIAESAFSDCDNLDSITIPGSISEIPCFAFSSCSNLTSVNILNGVISIDDQAFQSCLRLSNIIIPNSLKNIGNEVFNGCTSLSKITISESVTNIGERAFEGTNLRSIILPESVVSLGSGAFSYCENLKYIVLSNNIKSIDNACFYYCKKLSSIVIPDGVTSINSSSFESCENLKSVIIPSSVTSFGKNVFSDDNFDELTIYGESGSKAENYANVNDITFKIIGNEEPILAEPPSDEEYIESYHPYKDNTDESWTIHKEGAKRIALTFSEQTETDDDDNIYLYDGSNNVVGTYCGTELAGKRVIVSGDTVKIEFTSSSNYHDYYGFSLDQVQVYFDNCSHNKTEVRNQSNATCNEYGYTGDTYCIECNEKLTEGEAIPPTGHTYFDGVCTICGKLNPSSINTVIRPNTDLTTEILTKGQYRYYKFVPHRNGTINWYSTGNNDTYGYLYDSEFNEISYNDDGGNGSNYSITFDVEANKTYILGCRFYSSSKTGEFTVRLDYTVDNSTEPDINNKYLINDEPANGVYNNTYYVDGYAQDVTGLIEDNGTYYLFDEYYVTDGPYSGIYFDDSGEELTGRYFENGKPANPGIVLFQGDFYCTTTGGWLVKGEKQIYSSRTSGLISAGTYTFGDDFKMIDTETKNGIINDVYYENGVAKNVGLVRIGNDFYYTTSGGKIVHGDQIIYSSRTNGLLPGGVTYHFDEVTGKLYKDNVIIDDVYYKEGAAKNVGIVKVAGAYYVTTTKGVITKDAYNKYIASSRTNGLVAIGYYDFGLDGKMILRNGIIGGKYYVNGKATNVGLFEYEADGVTNIYCTTTGGVIIKDVTDKYIAKSRTNNLVPASYYSFDSEGRMIR